MVNQELLNYVNQQLVYGTNPDEIKKILLDAGWQENDIDDAVGRATNLFPEAIKPIEARRISGKKLLTPIFIGILIIGGGALGYFINSRNKIITPISISPTPTASTLPAELPIATSTPTAVRTPTPTPTHTATPTPTQSNQKILEKFATITYDGPLQNYPVTIDGYRVAKKFYETHPDAYDFIVTYSIIPTTLDGIGITVKNGIQGNGSFYPNLDDTAKYGSNGKLIGYIFMPPSLGLDANEGIDLLGMLAHEVSHHWIMFIGDIATCKDNPNFSVKCAKTTGFRVSKDGGHWSSNVDTFVREGGLVFKEPIGGLAWQMNAGGYCSGVATAGNGVRFNDIDLYLMGFMSPSEAKSIYWYDFTGDASDLGQKCTQHSLSAQDVINMEGPRQPNYTIAQRDFKIGFILVTAPGQSATQQEISKMNYIIDNFPAAWYEATRKLSTMNIPR